MTKAHRKLLEDLRAVIVGQNLHLHAPSLAPLLRRIKAALKS